VREREREREKSERERRVRERERERRKKSKSQNTINSKSCQRYFMLSVGEQGIFGMVFPSK
jgi:hypothetical protein